MAKIKTKKLNSEQKRQADAKIFLDDLKNNPKAGEKIIKTLNKDQQKRLKKLQKVEWDKKTPVQKKHIIDLGEKFKKEDETKTPLDVKNGLVRMHKRLDDYVPTKKLTVKTKKASVKDTFKNADKIINDGVGVLHELKNTKNRTKLLKNLITHEMKKLNPKKRIKLRKQLTDLNKKMDTQFGKPVSANQLKKSLLPNDFKPKNKKPETKEQALKRLRKSVAERKIDEITVLGKTVFVCQDTTILKIGHNTGILESNKMFTILDKKIQEFMVTMLVELLNPKRKHSVESRENYVTADTKAFQFAIKKYPKEKKKFWLFAFMIILKENNIELNHYRLTKAFDFMKLNKDAGVKKIKAQMKKEADAKKFLSDGIEGGEGDFIDDDYELIKKKSKKNPLESKIKVRDYHVTPVNQQPKLSGKKKPLKLYSMDELSDKTLGKIGTPERDKAEKELQDELKNSKKSVKKITKKNKTK